MARKALKIKEEIPQLYEVKPIKTKPYNDIDLNHWKDYEHIDTGTLWMYQSRAKGNGHSFDYHGNYIPQIAQQLYERYTKKGDIILDMFLGSGTSAIEAKNMQRRCIGIELNPSVVEYTSSKFSQKDLCTDIRIINGDSASKEIREKIQTNLELMTEKKAQFVVLHPPYDDIIKFSDNEKDLSNCKSTQEFYDLFEKVAKNAYDFLDKKRFASLIIGDKYTNGELIPLGFKCMEAMNNVGFTTKSIIIKNIEGNEKAKGKTSNLWRYRALAGGFNIFKHEYVIIFEKK